MLRFVAARFALAIPVLVIVSIGTFCLVYLVPGDPAEQIIGSTGTHAQYVAIRDQLGLNRPVVEQYFIWLGHALRGNLGNNIVPPVESVSLRIGQALPVDIELAVLGLVLALVIAVPVGVWSAYRQGSRVDRLISVATIGVISVPTFLLGLILLLVVAIRWNLLPVGQWTPLAWGHIGENLRHAFLPALILALGEAAVFIRLLRSDMIDTLQQDFILAARAKGMSVPHVLFREALRPSSFSLVTLSGLSVGRLIGGNIIVEQIFSLPGLGPMVVDAAQKSDYPLVQGTVLIIAVTYVAANLLVDVLYTVLDPRVRHSHG
jgi:peptide/nickel transport system permease protein